MGLKPWDLDRMTTNDVKRRLAWLKGDGMKLVGARLEMNGLGGGEDG